jgi:hypothetical protein
MHKLTLCFVAALLTAGISTFAWLARKPLPASELQVSNASSTQSPTVAICDLLSNPTAYDMKIIRVEGVIVVNSHYRALYDPSCLTMDPMIGVEADSSFSSQKLTGCQVDFLL